MSRVHNFSAGPAALPLPVVERIRADLPDWSGSGMSVMEVSHRSRDFMQLAANAEANLRQLLLMPDDYSILFMQGGATLQMAMVPMNLAHRQATADYVVTGRWGRKAAAEAARFCNVNLAANTAAQRFTCRPAADAWNARDTAAYLHITPNETIDGVEFHDIPPDIAAPGVPLVGDLSSTLLSRPLDVSRYGVIYAGAQKNLGIAGITLVIVRNDLLERAPPGLPTLMTWRAYAESASMQNTPPTFAWYVMDLVLQHLLDSGGLQAMAEVNDRKAAKLYRAIDESDFYGNPVDANCRSRMNVPFVLADAALDAAFLAAAQEAGLHSLKGHRSVGGMRASLYNAVSEAAVEALVAFMADFESRHG